MSAKKVLDEFEDNLNLGIRQIEMMSREKKEPPETLKVAYLLKNDLESIKKKYGYKNGLR